jgi:hypothetical protein
MVEKDEFIRLSKDWRSAVVLLPTFGLTLLKYLTFGIVAGCVVAIACQTRQPPRGGRQRARLVVRSRTPVAALPKAGIYSVRISRAIRSSNTIETLPFPASI